MNAIIIVLQSDLCADLYLGNNFRDFHSVFQNTKRTGIFENVYRYELINRERGLKYLYKRTFELMFPAHFLQKQLGHRDHKHYSHIYLSTLTEFAADLMMCNPNAEIIHFEDGIATYLSDYPSIKHGKTRRLQMLFHPDIFDKYKKPSFVYLNLPELASEKIRRNCHVEKIKYSESKYVELLSEVFGETKSVYGEKRIIFLSQPDEGVNDDLTRMLKKDICRILSETGHACIRFHPREYAENSMKDVSTGLWELLAEKDVTEKHVLVTLYSTAVFMPFILYGKEPYIILLYRLCGLHASEIAELESIVQRLKHLYTDKTKVVVPDSFAEFEAALKSAQL